MNGPILCDTTLRDGEQSPGVAFTAAEKISIARMLDEIGVPEIEVGTPAMGGEESEAVSGIVSLGLKARVLARNRALISDIDASLGCGVTVIAISLPVSDLQIERKLGRDRSWVLTQLCRSLKYAVRRGLSVCAGAEDASRADQEFLCEFARAAAACGAERIRFCDTVGRLDPEETFKKVSDLVSRVPLPVEIHTHNDFGLAVANALAGIRAGVQVVSTTVLGLGERAGNAALEQIVMSLKHLHGMETKVRTERLRPLCETVAQACGREIPPGQPVVGEAAFTHESGIHADGVLKDPALYEPYRPEETGGVRKIVLGKHSGRRALLHKLKELGLPLESLQVSDLLEKVRCLSLRRKRSLADWELSRLYEETFVLPDAVEPPCRGKV